MLHACIWFLKVSRIPSDWEEQGEAAKKTAEGGHVVYSSPPHDARWWVVQEGGSDSATQTLCIELRVWEKVENHCSVWPLSWAKAKQIHLSQQFPSTSFSQAPWWHQPCFRNYLTSVFQISSEPARVTNTHSNSGKLSTHRTGCWPSGMNYSFMSLFVLYLGKDCMKPSIMCPQETTGKPLSPMEMSVLLPDRCKYSRYLLFLISVCYFVLLPSSSGSCSHSPYKHGKSSFITDIYNKHADTWDVNREAGIITEPLNQPQDLVSIISDRTSILQDTGQKVEK